MTPAGMLLCSERALGANSSHSPSLRAARQRNRSQTVLAVPSARRPLIPRFRTKSLRCGSRPFLARNCRKQVQKSWITISLTR